MNHFSEESISSILQGFFLFLATIVAVFILCMNSLMFDQTVGNINGGIPAIVFLVGLIAFFLSLFRSLCDLLVKPATKPIIEALALIGTCIAPFMILFSQVWLLALPLIAAGMAATIFSWCVYLCNFSHKLLVSYVAIAFAAAGVIAALIMFLGLSNTTLVAIFCILMFFSWLFLVFESRKKSPKFVLVSAAESKKRAATINIDRWTYSVIGLDFGFAIGLAHFLVNSQNNSFVFLGLQETHLLIAVFAIPAILSGLFLLVFRSKFEYVIEQYSKDFLAFSIALCLLPLYYVSPWLQLICVMLLLVVGFVQLIIVINASIEFIRFDQLSPAWYIAEGAFVVGGIALGIGCSWIIFSQNSILFLPIFCNTIVLINIFAQYFINRGAYPKSSEARLLEAPPETTLDYQNEPMENLAKQLNMVPKKGLWRAKIGYVSDQYDLSPRQGEVLELLAKGRDAKYIEDHFCISRSTTKSHIYNIYCKLDIHSRQELLDIIESISDSEAMQYIALAHKKNTP